MEAFRRKDDYELRGLKPTSSENLDLEVLGRMLREMSTSVQKTSNLIAHMQSMIYSAELKRQAQDNGSKQGE